MTNIKEKLGAKLAMSRLYALRSGWLLTRDLTRTMDAAVVQIAYSRSKWNRSAAHWDQITATMSEDPVVAEAIRSRKRVGRLDIKAMLALPENTLGRQFADHVVRTNIQLGLLKPFPIEKDSEYMFVHFVETHDIWHVVSGFGVDDLGEAGIIGFSAAQFASAPHFALVAGIVFLNAAFREPTTFGPRMEAMTRGWQMGCQARTLVGADWASLWDKPLSEVRQMYDLPVDPKPVGLGLAEAPPHLAQVG